MASDLVSTIKLIGLSSASILSAWIASFSLVSIPAVQMAPTELGVRQWLRIFNIGKNTAPPFAITCSACFAFLAYQTRKVNGRFPIGPAYLYGSAAVLAPCIMPYTRLVMWNGVQALESRALGQASALTDQEVKHLITIWSKQNLTRSWIVATAGLLGLFATLS